MTQTFFIYCLRQCSNLSIEDAICRLYSYHTSLMYYRIEILFLKISGAPVSRLVYNQVLHYSHQQKYSIRKISLEESTAGSFTSTVSGSTILPRSLLFYHNKRPSPLCKRCRQRSYFQFCSCREGFIGLPIKHVLRAKVRHFTVLFY